MSRDVKYYSPRSLDKIAESIARWISGLKPRYGRYSYYFQRFYIDEEVKKNFRQSDGRTCTICGKSFKNRRTLAVHILQAHKHYIIEILRSCVRRE